ncbi:hypothetical protein NRA64_09090 [Acinetobacter baumannii]|nr:hypothetical protein [Acinetobacter baumannii]
MDLFNRHDNLFRSIIVALILLVFNQSLFAAVSNPTFDTSFRTSGAGGVARTVFKSFKNGGAWGVVAVSTAVVGNELHNRYQNGEFNVAANDIKNMTAFLFAKGVTSTGWLADQINKLKQKYDCDATANCRSKDVDYSYAKFNDVKFCRVSVCAESIAEVLVQVRPPTQTYYYTYKFSDLSALNTTSTNGKIIGEITCHSFEGKRCNGLATSTSSYELVFFKNNIAITESDIKNNTEIRPIVKPDVIAQQVDQPASMSDYADVVGTCAGFGCINLSSAESVPTRIPSDSSIEYPRPTVPAIPDNTSSTIIDPSSPSVPTEEGSNPSVEAFDLPSFCSWAEPVCNFINWMKSDDLGEQEQYDLTPKQIDLTQVNAREFNFGSAQCPANQSLDIDFGLVHKQVPIPLDNLCLFLMKIRPYLIAISYLGAAFIVTKGRS